MSPTNLCYCLFYQYIAMSKPEEPTEEDKRLLDMEVEELGNKAEDMPAKKNDERPPRSRSRSPPKDSLPAPPINNNNNK